jgi:HlyD family secretion protein
MSRARIRVLVAALVVMVAAGIAAGVLFAHRAADTSPDASATAAPSVPLAVARTGTFVVRVEAQGRIGAPAGSSSKIGFAQPGIVRSVDVRVGETVVAGQTLAALDRASLGTSVQAAQADVLGTGANTPGTASAAEQSARARLAVANDKLAMLEAGGPAALDARIAAQSAARQSTLKLDADRATLARDETLLNAGVVAGKDVDAARAQLASDEADVQAANAKVAAAATDFQAALKQARADVAGARSDVQAASGQAAAAQARLAAARIAYQNGALTAPANGVVLSILKHPGESVDPSVPVIEVGPPQSHDVTLTVPAATARDVRVGDRATISVVARAGAARGVVAAVVPAVDPSTQVGTIVVRGAPPDVVPGDAVTATIVVGHDVGVLVPSSAIVQDPQSGRTVVFVRAAHPKAADSAFALRSVVVRRSDPATAVVASGLRPGEHVAAQGGYLLLAPAGG